MAFSGTEITSLRPNAVTGQKWGSFAGRATVVTIPPLTIQLMGTESLTSGLLGTSSPTTDLSGLLEG